MLHTERDYTRVNAKEAEGINVKMIARNKKTFKGCGSTFIALQKRQIWNHGPPPLIECIDQIKVFFDDNSSLLPAEF